MHIAQFFVQYGFRIYIPIILKKIIHIASPYSYCNMQYAYGDKKCNMHIKSKWVFWFKNTNKQQHQRRGNKPSFVFLKITSFGDSPLRGLIVTMRHWPMKIVEPLLLPAAAVAANENS